MPWVKIDDQMPQHPKIAQAGPLALAMQVAGLCYSNRHLTDGFIPWSVARSLLCWQFTSTNDNGETVVVSISVSSGMSGSDVDAEYVINLLVEAGIWDEVSGGYRIHDYAEYQPSKAQVLAEKAAKRSAGQAGGQARAQAAAKRALKQNASKAPSEIQAKSKPDPVPLREEDDEEETAASAQAPAQAAAKHVLVERVPEVTVGDVSREWHAAATPGVLHGPSGWRGDYGDIADAINRHPKIRPENRHRVLTKLCLWVWQDPEGPRARGVKITPAVVSKRVTEDIDAAVTSMWVASRLPPLEGAA